MHGIGIVHVYLVKYPAYWGIILRKIGKMVLETDLSLLIREEYFRGDWFHLEIKKIFLSVLLTITYQIYFKPCSSCKLIT